MVEPKSESVSTGQTKCSCRNSVGTEGGLLSDLEILERLVACDKHIIFVSPIIDPKEQLGPASLDLRLGTELSVVRNIDLPFIDLKEYASEEEAKKKIKQHYEQRVADPSGGFVLHPGEFALASTLEYIRLPLDIAARLEGRSSWGRLGLQVHATAGFVDPGFQGPLTFELINAGRVPLKLYAGLRLGQICFFKTTEVQVGYMNKTSCKYGDQTGAEPSRFYLDTEIKRTSKPE